jgi:hypothetical protein
MGIWQSICFTEGPSIMPNWCENRLTVTGSPDDLDGFLSTVLTYDEEGQQNLDFETILPCPTGLEYHYPQTAVQRLALSMYRRKHHPGSLSMEDVMAVVLDRDNIINEDDVEQIVGDAIARHKQFGASSGYDWRIKFWGSKWNAAYTSVNRTDDQVLISFDTAWSPPIPIVRTMAKMLPALVFDHMYLESGAFYSGIGHYHGDEVSEESWNNISDKIFMQMWGYVPGDDDEAD